MLDEVARLRSHLSNASVCVCVCIYSPSGPLSPAGPSLPQRLIVAGFCYVTVVSSSACLHLSMTLCCSGFGIVKS